jgi:hypothetical protein
MQRNQDDADHDGIMRNVRRHNVPLKDSLFLPPLLDRFSSRRVVPLLPLSTLVIEEESMWSSSTLHFRETTLA